MIVRGSRKNWKRIIGAAIRPEINVKRSSRKKGQILQSSCRFARYDVVVGKVGAKI